MKIKDIELENISRYRGELMGAAMLFVILFHVGLPRDDMFFGLRRMGNIGVDIHGQSTPTPKIFIFVVGSVFILHGSLWLAYTIFLILLALIGYIIEDIVQISSI